MEKIIPAILTGIFCLFIGFVIGEHNTVSYDEYESQVNEYEKRIGFYQDYIRGLDQFVSPDTINNQSLQILREKIDLQGND